MSDFSQIIVDLDATPEEAERLGVAVLEWLAGEGIVQRKTSDSTLGSEGHRPGRNYRKVITDDHDLLGLATNGLEIMTGRTVFEAGGNGIELRCDACQHQFQPEDDWFDAVGVWFEGDDEVTFSCPRCHEARRLPEWRGPWQWGFGNLGFQFWNWPPLTEEFIHSVAEKLGHRTVLVRRHL